MAAVCRALSVARATGYLRLRSRVGSFYRRAEDHEVLLSILSVTRSRASYDYRRTLTLVNRDRREKGDPPYNWKSVRRVMRINDLMLPGKKRSRVDRPHKGKVAMPASNQRWCSDGFNIRCWNGDLVRVAFALDCHDREAVAHVAVARDLNGHDDGRIVARAIVDDEDLDVCIRLAERAPDRRGKEASLIEAGNDDGDKRPSAQIGRRGVFADRAGSRHAQLFAMILAERYQPCQRYFWRSRKIRVEVGVELHHQIADGGRRKHR
jgi:hypothetical protein